MLSSDNAALIQINKCLLHSTSILDINVLEYLYEVRRKDSPFKSQEAWLSKARNKTTRIKYAILIYLDSSDMVIALLAADLSTELL